MCVFLHICTAGFWIRMQQTVRGLPTFHLEPVSIKTFSISYNFDVYSMKNFNVPVKILIGCEKCLLAGRHRCVGESFAYTQIKTIWSVLLTKYEFSLIDGYFPAVNYSTMIHTPTRPVISYKRR